MKIKNIEDRKEKEKAILDLLDGKLTPVTGHISRSKSKFHDVEPHLRKKRKPPFLNGEESYKKKPPFLNGEPT